MARYGRLLTDAQWERSGPCSRNDPSARAAGGLRPTTAKCWKAFCGFCAAALAGRICPRSFRRPRPAGDGCGIGKSKRIWLEDLARVSGRVE